MYNTINVINTDVWYMKVAKRVDPTSTHHKENIFSFFLILYLYEMLDVH